MYLQIALDDPGKGLRRVLTFNMDNVTVVDVQYEKGHVDIQLMNGKTAWVTGMNLDQLVLIDNAVTELMSSRNTNKSQLVILSIEGAESGESDG